MGLLCSLMTVDSSPSSKRRRFITVSAMDSESAKVKFLWFFSDFWILDSVSDSVAHDSSIFFFFLFLNLFCADLSCSLQIMSYLYSIYDLLVCVIFINKY